MTHSDKAPTAERLARRIADEVTDFPKPPRDPMRWQTAYDAALAAIDKTREALAPFVREADNHDRDDIADDHIFAGDLTFGDLRRARGLYLEKTHD